MVDLSGLKPETLLLSNLEISYFRQICIIKSDLPPKFASKGIQYLFNLIKKQHSKNLLNLSTDKTHPNLNSSYLQLQSLYNHSNLQ